MSNKRQKLAYGGFLLEWLLGQIKRALEMFFWPIMTLQRGRAGNSEADDENNDNDSDTDMEKSAALLKRAGKEQQRGDFFKAMATYVRVLQLQLKHRAAPRESSPSRQALRQMMEMLQHKFHGARVTFEVSWCGCQTRCGSIQRSPARLRIYPKGCWIRERSPST